ncbi:hypothetical protein ACFQQB_57530 [Nonomuraea rubra]|uniref:hypothetical protein n=1 Tax=Nonomuraea rubra TaxID=46180 RepID=UPI0031EB3B71
MSRPVGRGWYDDGLCLWREDGDWCLQGSDGVIEVDGLGGAIAARNVAGPRPRPPSRN